MPILGDHWQVYMAGQLTLHMQTLMLRPPSWYGRVNVPIPYIICWTLVSQSFMQLTHGRERANWPQSRLILASSLPVQSEPRAKKSVFIHICGCWNTSYLIVFVSLAMLGPFCCTNNRIIISLLYMYKSITVQNYRGVYRNFNKWPGKYCHV